MKTTQIPFSMKEGIFISKSELILKIKNGLRDAKLHKEGKIKLNTLSEFLDNLSLLSGTIIVRGSKAA